MDKKNITGAMKVEKAFVQGKMEKYGVTRKTVYSSMSLLACASLIIVLSITQAYFDPQKLKTIQYWVNLMIQIALCIFGMIAGKQAGDDIARNTPDGRYKTSLRNYLSVISLIKDMGLYSYISDWLETFRQRKLTRKTNEFLYDNGIKQLEVLDLDFHDLENLREPGFSKNWDNTPYRAKYWDEKRGESRTNFVSYTKEQIEVIRRVKMGYIKVSQLPSTFFVSAFSQSERDEWESAANAGRKKGLYLGINYGYRVVGMALFSVLMTGLEVMSTGAGTGEEVARMWMTMISRIGTLLMSYIWGAFVGFNVVKIDNDYLDFKVTTMTNFTEEVKNGVFKIRTVKEQADAAYENRKKLETGQLSVVEGESAHTIE